MNIPMEDVYCNDFTDKFRYEAHNMFPTKEEAQKEADTTLVWRDLRAFAKKWNEKEYGIRFAPMPVLNGVEFNHKDGIAAAKKHFGDKLRLLDFRLT